MADQDDIMDDLDKVLGDVEDGPGAPEEEGAVDPDRVKAALLNAGFDFPDGLLTISLAPADLPKDGSRFDLPIALGILAATAATIGTVAIPEMIERVVGRVVHQAERATAAPVDVVAPHGVDLRHGDPALIEQSGKVISIGRRGHLHVQAGAGCLPGGFPVIGGEAVHAQLLDRSPVADDETLVVPLIAQDCAQQKFVCRRRHTVDS